MESQAGSQRVDTLWHFSDRSLEALLAVLRGQVDAEPVASQWRGLEAFGEFAAFRGTRTGRGSQLSRNVRSVPGWPSQAGPLLVADVQPEGGRRVASCYPHHRRAIHAYQVRQLFGIRGLNVDDLNHDASIGG